MLLGTVPAGIRLVAIVDKANARDEMLNELSIAIEQRAGTRKKSG